MRHLCLTVVAVMVASGDASAKRVMCSCPTRIVLPQPGAQGVPLNSRIWIINDGYYEVRTPALTAGQEHVDTDGVRFTPSAELDTTAPDTPSNVNASMVVRSSDWRVETLSLFGAYSADTALVEINVREPAGKTQIVTTPTRLFMCQPGARASTAPTRLSITAIDLAGNRSAPLELEIKPTIVSGHDRDTDCMAGQTWGHPRRYGHGFEILFAVFVYAIGLVVWFIAKIVLRLMAKRAPGEPLTLLEAEEIVRRLLRWQVVWAVLLSVASIGLYASSRREESQLLAYAISPFAFVAWCRVLMTRWAQALVAREHASAVRHGPWIEVSAVAHSVLLRASDIDFVVAKRNNIPRSVAKQ
jgi:hypothetical protein